MWGHNVHNTQQQQQQQQQRQQHNGHHYNTSMHSNNAVNMAYGGHVNHSGHNGNHVQNNWFSEAGPSFVSTVTSLGTPILTPTTLANIEQTFIELTNVPTATSAQSEVADLSRRSGFVPPVVDPVTSSSMTLGGYSDDSSSSDWSQPSTKRGRYEDMPSGAIVIAPATTTGGLTASGQPRRTPGPRRSRNNEKLTPEEERRRHLRRERNKLAAAKCRQRRVDQTNTLVGETEQLEEEKASLENEIESLTQVKEHLKFVLEAHQPVCQKCIRTDVEVKVEEASSSPAAHGLHLPSVSHVMARPTSLSLASRTVLGTMQTSKPTNTVTEATGITISTPSSGVLNFGAISFDGIVDGHTGLTPLTGAPSCASELQRSSSDSSPNENLHSPTLMAL